MALLLEMNCAAAGETPQDSGEAAHQAAMAYAAAAAMAAGGIPPPPPPPSLSTTAAASNASGTFYHHHNSQQQTQQIHAQQQHLHTPNPSSHHFGCFVSGAAAADPFNYGSFLQHQTSYPQATAVAGGNNLLQQQQHLHHRPHANYAFGGGSSTTNLLYHQPQLGGGGALGHKPIGDNGFVPGGNYLSSSSRQPPAGEWRGTDLYLRVGATIEIGTSPTAMPTHHSLGGWHGPSVAAGNDLLLEVGGGSGFLMPAVSASFSSAAYPPPPHQLGFHSSGAEFQLLAEGDHNQLGLGGTSVVKCPPQGIGTGGRGVVREVASGTAHPKKGGAPKRSNSSVNIAEGNKCYACGVCGKQYCRKSTLRAHMKQHHVGDQQRPFNCQICGKHFSQAANLAAHRRVHTGEKPFRCPICHRPFSQSSSLVTHKRTHTGERPYPCPHCEKAFTDSSTLTKHLRTHSGHKPYACALCLMKFSQSGNLHRHMKTHCSIGAGGGGLLIPPRH